jgi:hypothetical protein
VMIGNARAGTFVRMKKSCMADRRHGHILSRSPAGS